MIRQARAIKFMVAFKVGDLVEVASKIVNGVYVFNDKSIYEVLELPSKTNCGTYLLFNKTSSFKKKGEVWGCSTYVSPELIRAYKNNFDHYEQLKLL